MYDSLAYSPPLSMIMLSIINDIVYIGFRDPNNMDYVFVLQAGN